jgi:hypothetical protein
MARWLCFSWSQLDLKPIRSRARSSCSQSRLISYSWAIRSALSASIQRYEVQAAENSG